MSTRSNIGVQNQDGSVTFIYCHFDGYPSHHVPILTTHYATLDKALALVAPGNMSSLGSVGEKHDFEDRTKCDAGWCRYYGRDRGDKNTEAQTVGTVEEYSRAADNDYAYLFRGGKWFCRSRNGSWATATEVLEVEG